MILGLTGGIATGKSTVAEFFREKKIPVICADTIAREITEKQEILDEISVEFGKEMIVDGKLNRKKMREYIFVDINRVKKLNEITHPPIIEKIKDDKISEILFKDINNQTKLGVLKFQYAFFSKDKECIDKYKDYFKIKP